MGHSYCQDGSPQAAAALPWGPAWAAGDYLLQRGPPLGCSGTACLTMDFSTSCRGNHTPVPGAPPPPPSALTSMSARLFLSNFSHSCCTAVFTLS